MLLIIEVLRLFVSDETGFVKQENSLALPWTASVMIAAAVMLGGPTASEADTSWSWHDHGACSSDQQCAQECWRQGHGNGFVCTGGGTCRCK